MIEELQIHETARFEFIGKVDIDEHDGDFNEFLIGEWSFNDIITRYVDKSVKLEITIQVLNDKPL